MVISVWPRRNTDHLSEVVQILAPLTLGMEWEVEDDPGNNVENKFGSQFFHRECLSCLCQLVQAAMKRQAFVYHEACQGSDMSPGKGRSHGVVQAFPEGPIGRRK